MTDPTPEPDQIQQLSALLGESDNLVNVLRQRCALLNIEVQKRDQHIAQLQERLTHYDESQTQPQEGRS